jgi:hypothetical protein
MKALLVVLLLLGATSAHAQNAVPPLVLESREWRAAQTPTASTGSMVLGGLLLGAAGFFGGGYLGAIIADRSSDLEFAALTGFVVGAVIGETAGLPLGVHLANKRRGEYAPSLLVSAGIAAVGLALASSDDDNLEFLIPVPIAQLIASIAIERRTAN